MNGTGQHRWEAVYAAVRALIDAGTLGPGDQVPTEAQLAAEHGVSRQTVRQALGRLEQEGLITAGAGRLGRTVREYRPVAWHLTAHDRGGSPDDPPGGIGGWDQDIRNQEREPSQLVQVDSLKATEYVAGKLGLRVGTQAIRRRRVRIVDGMRVALADSWVPRDIARMELVRGYAPLLADVDPPISGGILRGLGIVQVQFRDEIQVRMPTPEESAILHLEPGSPVGQHTRVGLDADGRAVRVIITVFPGHRLRCLYTLDV
jgi:GntR family transcriptional regulator